MVKITLFIKKDKNIFDEAWTYYTLRFLSFKKVEVIGMFLVEINHPSSQLFSLRPPKYVSCQKKKKRTHTHTLKTKMGLSFFRKAKVSLRGVDI